MNKKLRYYVLFIILTTIQLQSQISGPKQPEYTTFEPVSTSNMVNEQTGAFTYNIPILMVPGPNGSGYPLSLSYHSGSSPEDEASWVGFGWTLNPGAINRQTKGFPDDFNGAVVKYYNKQRPIITATNTVKIGFEIMSSDFLGMSGAFGLSYSKNTSFNTHNYFNISHGAGLRSPYGSANLEYNENGNVSISWQPNLFEIAGGLSGEFKKETAKFNSSFAKRMMSGINSNILSSASFYSNRDYGLGNFSFSTGNISGENYIFTPNIRYDGPFNHFGIEASPGFNYNVSTQKPVPKLEKQVLGYMYTHLEFAQDNNIEYILDYYNEKDGSVTKRESNLPIPFSNADNFVLTGEGIGGGFKLSSRKSGHFRPENTKSLTSTLGGGITGSFGGVLDPPGASVGGGANVFFGSSTNEQIGWFSPYYLYFDGDKYILVEDPIYKDKYKDGYLFKDFIAYQNSKSVNVPNMFFKFHNDLGNNLNFYNIDEIENMLMPQSAFFGSSSTPNVSNLKDIAETQGSGTSNVQYMTFEELREWEDILTYIKDDNYEQYTSKITGMNDKAIANVTVTNSDGMKYHYGLPVINRNEANLTFGITDLNRGVATNYTINSFISYYTIDDNYDNYVNSDNNVLTGSVTKEPYAGTFLLTLIMSPDYVDITGDGPTEDDLGGYTKFNYRRASGTDDKASEDKWFKWRRPYNGLYYNKNSLSEKRDETGTVTYGEKEIYYLESIETKTHKAIFVTNKTTLNVKYKSDTITIEGQRDEEDNFIERKDLYTAVHNEELATGSNTYTWRQGETDQAVNISEYLQRIELYAKNTKEPESLTQKLQTIYFEYDDYTAWEGQFNSYENAGKLTLKKVWVENEEVKEPTISPYVFHYEYPNKVEEEEITFPTKYSSIEQYFIESGTLQFDEKPKYNPLDLDNWGNYQDDDGIFNSIVRTDYTGFVEGLLSGLTNSRKFNDRDWINQKSVNKFDPAAWNLKRVTLPSGGEIMVQYEQNQYSFVQNKRPHALVRLHSIENDLVKLKIEDDLDLPSNTTEKEKILDDIVESIEREYQVTGKRMYFNALYAFGVVWPVPAMNGG